MRRRVRRRLRLRLLLLVPPTMLGPVLLLGPGRSNSLSTSPPPPLPLSSLYLAYTSFSCSYAQFQISDGVAGNALAEAQAIFVDPFAGVDLATLDASVATDMETMRKAAENAETELFNPAIEAATGAEKDALAAGKTKNKVLKLTAFNQVLAIKVCFSFLSFWC